MSENRKIFKLIEFEPVGFKIINCPVPYCSFCRGSINDICASCKENNKYNITLCTVRKCNDKVYYHTHCYMLLNIN